MHSSKENKKSFLDWDGTPEGWLECFGLSAQQINEVKLRWVEDDFNNIHALVKPQFKCLPIHDLCKSILGINPTQQSSKENHHH